MSKIQLVVTTYNNTILKGKRTTYVLSIQRENGNGTKILGKSDISKETKKEEIKTKRTRVAVGALAYQIMNNG